MTVQQAPGYPFRLLSTGCRDAYYNMALDEALMESTAAGALPALRFYGWNPPAVSIGFSQELEEEVDTDAARRHGFNLVRRISGGGAVLHRSELTYSIIMELRHPLAGKALEESYFILCGGLIRGLSLLGVESFFSGTNDILTGGKKISGNAQIRRMGCLLQHGTILLDSDAEAMFDVLKTPKDKSKGRLTGEIKSRVTSLRSILGRDVSFTRAESVFARGFKEALNLDLQNAAVSPAEEERAGELAETKFSSREWIYKR